MVFKICCMLRTVFVKAIIFSTLIRMHNSTKTAHFNKAKSRNNQTSTSYNACIDFIPTTNYSHAEQQSQMNRKHINNNGNISEVAVVQYNRTCNVQVENNREIKSFQSITHDSHETNIFRSSYQYQPNINSNDLQKSQLNKSFQIKKIKEQHQSMEKFQSLKNNDFYRKDVSSSNIKKTKEFENTKVHQQKQHTIINQKPNSSSKSRLESKLNEYGKNPRTQTNTFNNEQKMELLNEDAPCLLSSTTVANISIQKNNEDSNKEQSAVKNNMECNATEDHPNANDNVEKELNNINAKSDEVLLEDMNQTSIKGTREKTPMCLINDLARFNKISFQYRLTSENGPAHCKRFTVTLKLGDEEYTADGFKIKKAQHLAAKEAIGNTKYKHPIPKTNRRNDDSGVMKSNITPTVELNALAMKLGQQTYYIFDSRQITSSDNITHNNINQAKTVQLFESSRFRLIQQPVVVNNFGCTFVPNSNGKQVQTSNQNRPLLSKFHNRYSAFQHSIQTCTVPKTNPLNSTYFPATSPCKITLIVGTQKFVGIGRTLQQAKHDAAANALHVLKEQINRVQIETTHNESIDENDHKSPISLVFEIGIKRNLPVDFKVLREEGPAHMRIFTTACIVGEIITEGEGTGKKISKKKAAQKMLGELNKLPPLTQVTSPIKRVKLKTASKKNGITPSPKSINLIDSKEETQQRQCDRNKKQITETDTENPITKLLEWHQNNKEKEPVFTLISEFGKENSRRRHFVMELSSNRFVARGVGNSKKLAKRDAAQNYLMAVCGDFKICSVTKNDDISKEFTSAVTNIEEHVSNLKESKLHVTTADEFSLSHNHEVLNKPKLNVDKIGEENKKKMNIPNSDNKNTGDSVQLVLGKKGSSSYNSSSSSTILKSTSLHMKDQLLYLAKLLGFEVDFSDYPKGNHNEFLTIVMLSTNPPQICHGVGIDATQSQEDAAKNALKILSEMGLNNAVNS